MIYYLKPKKFSSDRLLTEVDGDKLYRVDTDKGLFGTKFQIFNMSQDEVAEIQKKRLSFGPRFIATMNDQVVAEIAKDKKMFFDGFQVTGPEWFVGAGILDRDYVIAKDKKMKEAVAKVSYDAESETYTLDIQPGVDPLMVLITVVSLEWIIEDKEEDVEKEEETK